METEEEKKKRELREFLEWWPDTGLPEGPGREELGENDAFNDDSSQGEQVAVDGTRRRGSPERNLSIRVDGGRGIDGVGPLDTIGALSGSDLVPDFGPDYLNLPPEFTLQDAVPWAAMVGKWERGRQWYAGDLLNGLEARFGADRVWSEIAVRQCWNCNGEMWFDDEIKCDECFDGLQHASIPEILGMTYPSLRNCQRVCEAFSPGERYPLSFGHHAATYGIADRAQRDRLMAQATAEGWPVSRLREAVSGHTEPETCICPSCGKVHRKEPTIS